MKNNIRFVPVQKLCLVCSTELQARDGTLGLAGRLCRECIQMVREQVLREVVANPKIVRVQ
jgi:hypothetical protein